jgi:hypothetical protein
MTEQARQSQRPAPRRRRKPSPVPVVAGSMATFLGLFGFLAYQLRTGHDPALGQKVASVQTVVQPRQVVVKRLERKIIVTKLIPTEEGGSTPIRIAIPAGTPVVTQSAPVVTQSAPAPVPAAPAPIVTSASGAVR